MSGPAFLAWQNAGHFLTIDGQYLFELD